MAKGSNQKLKLSYLIKIMMERTDEKHGITMPQIMAELERYGVTAERKSVYSDFQDMRDYLGIDINKVQVGRDTYYSVNSRQFELAEIKLLIDAIQSSKFITRKKSQDLINKIKSLVSEHQAKQLQRQVFITDRVKTMNESVYYNVDGIHEAINDNKKIKFKYYKWDINKNLVPRRNEYYVVSPWALTWDDENYYLIAYADSEQMLKHYRVDKMKDISMLEEKCEGKKAFESFDITAYSKSRFSMFNGKMERVQIQFPNECCGVFIDRFGKDITFRKKDEHTSILTVDVAVSNQFFGWIFALGKDVKIIGPQIVVDRMKEAVREVGERY